MICLTLKGPTIKDNLEALEANREYIDICELRLDLLTSEEQGKASSFATMTDLPVILTLRRAADGGKCTLQEKARRALLIETLDGGGFSYVDIEDDVKKSDVEEKAHEKGVKVIRSYHDFNGVPEDIYSKLASLSSRGDVAKIAVTPRSIADVIMLFRINEELSDTPKIIIGMGDWGVCTRILYKRMGSILTFGSADGEKIAPGMISARELKELYHADTLDSRTGIYGIVGNPVMHTLSPFIHNPGFHQIHYNAVYVPFLADSARSFLVLAEYLRMRGFSVTVPFKNDIVRFLGNITREVKQIGSCNTVVRVPNMWKGTNTDYYGFLSPIEEDIEEGRVRSALVCGAGGAARSIVWALRIRGVSVTVVNRTFEKAEKLARLYSVSADTLENVSDYEGKVDLVVQATSAGMEGSDNVDPLSGFTFTGREIAYDIVYAPRNTPFLMHAAAAGCRLIHGEDMLMAQGKLQFEVFTGYHYPSSIKSPF